MSEKVSGRIRCSSCGEGFTAEAWSSINVSENPELKESVKNGSVFMCVCPHCGTANLMSHPLLYHDPEEKLLVWLTDGTETVIEKAKAVFSNTEGLADYTGRLVDDIGAVIEKVKIFDAGLDDIVVELVKFVTTNEMGKDIELKFYKMEGVDGELTFTYPKNGNMEMIAVGFNVYEDCRGILQRNKALGESARGLVKIDSVWLSGFLKG